MLPLIGMGLFVILFLVTTWQYNTKLDGLANNISFSLRENYLCELLNINTYEGVVNPAYITARIALTIICFSYILFWYQLPKLFPLKNNRQKFMQVNGMLSMAILLFLATGNHDTIIRIAGFFWAIAILFALIELYKTGFYVHFVFGTFCLLLFLYNYVIYEAEIQLELLPIIQKITFVLFLSWFAYLNRLLYLKIKSNH